MLSRQTFSIFAAFTTLILSFAPGSHRAFAASEAEEAANYDRLDGTGRSGKKVHVIEWEGNLELHVYPKGSLKGLALKLDDRDKKRPVMVIGYRFDNSPTGAAGSLIRRAILGIELKSGFQVYKDPSEPDFDKILISNNGLASPAVAYRTEGEPRQLYPDGHPALAAAAPDTKPADSAEDAGGAEERVPASGTRPARKASARRAALDEDTGTIHPFFMREDTLSRNPGR
jgi:hypothetical protein